MTGETDMEKMKRTLAMEQGADGLSVHGCMVTSLLLSERAKQADKDAKQADKDRQYAAQLRRKSLELRRAQEANEDLMRSAVEAPREFVEQGSDRAGRHEGSGRAERHQEEGSGRAGRHEEEDSEDEDSDRAQEANEALAASSVSEAQWSRLLGMIAGVLKVRPRMKAAELIKDIAFHVQSDNISAKVVADAVAAYFQAEAAYFRAECHQEERSGEDSEDEDSDGQNRHDGQNRREGDGTGGDSDENSEKNEESDENSEKDEDEEDCAAHVQGELVNHVLRISSDLQSSFVQPVCTAKKKALNGWLMFCREQREAVKADLSEPGKQASFAAVSSELSCRWQALGVDERATRTKAAREAAAAAGPIRNCGVAAPPRLTERASAAIRDAASAVMSGGGVLWRLKAMSQRRLRDGKRLMAKGARSVKEHMFKGSKVVWRKIVIIFQLLACTIGADKVGPLLLETLRRSVAPVRGEPR